LTSRRVVDTIDVSPQGRGTGLTSGTRHTRRLRQYRHGPPGRCATLFGTGAICQGGKIAGASCWHAIGDSLSARDAIDDVNGLI